MDSVNGMPVYCRGSPSTQRYRPTRREEKDGLRPSLLLREEFDNTISSNVVGTSVSKPLPNPTPGAQLQPRRALGS